MNEKMLQIELNKVKREIKTHGRSYVVKRTVLNNYGEDTDKQDEITEIQGLFHTEKGYVTKSISDGSKTHSKGQSKLMVAYDDSVLIKNGDMIQINENTYKVIEKNNIQEFNIVCDISMELVLNGNN